jgi:hypothetical protein
MQIYVTWHVIQCNHQVPFYATACMRVHLHPQQVHHRCSRLLPTAAASDTSTLDKHTTHLNLGSAHTHTHMHTVIPNKHTHHHTKPWTSAPAEPCGCHQSLQPHRHISQPWTTANFPPSHTLRDAHGSALGSDKGRSLRVNLDMRATQLQHRPICCTATCSLPLQPSKPPCQHLLCHVAGSCCTARCEHSIA